MSRSLGAFHLIAAPSAMCAAWLSAVLLLLTACSAASAPGSTEEHVVFGAGVDMARSGSASSRGWTFGSAGGSWHVWTYEAPLDRTELPPWPDAMDEARVVVSSGMCRGAPPIPPAPFMPPDDLEHCGVHTIATARDNVRAGAPMDVARREMRRWLAAFAGWSDRDSAAFSDLGAASIYHFRAHTAKTLGLRNGRRLDLGPLATRACPGLGLGVPAPVVTHQGAQWPDNYRLEVQLRRAAHGQVTVRVQTVSLLPTAEISVEPLANATSRIAWIGPNKGADAFALTAGQPRPQALAVPDEFYARSPARSAGEFSTRAEHFASFHPELALTAAVHPGGVHPEGCQLATLLALPRTYFFDPYQLRQLHIEGRLGAGSSYSHHGPIELELPAESLANWGSVLALVSPIPAEPLALTVPIHARYRLLPVDGPTVGYHGEPTGESHVDQTLPPPLAAIVCPAPAATHYGGVLDTLHIRLALFDELGLAPVASLMVAVDTDTLLRLPIPSARHAALIQASTVALFFAGALSTLYSIWMKKKGHQ
ncbi:protease B nonderepressible form [Coemansia spiralis]|nr:protease B nonderepressible form [Coemansia spiralis]